MYDHSFPPGPPTASASSRYSSQAPSSFTESGGTSAGTPPVPPRGGLERRSHTVVSRVRRSDQAALTRRLSTSDVTSSASDANASDTLTDHVVSNEPKEHASEVPLGALISVHFDRDVRTVNISKLFEVHCNSVDPSLNPVKGRINYDARAQRAEFIPHNTLYPSSKYTVILMGRAVTTTQCTNSNKIKNAELHFETCSPAPKTIGIKLKEQADSKPDVLQIDKYYDLYNSLVIWSTRKWGCSGEHITGLYTKNEAGKFQPLKADHDVLNLKENDVVLVEIKD